MAAASRQVRITDSEYVPAAPLSIPSGTIGQFSGARGTSALSSGTASFASGFASFAFGFTPGIVHATAHEAHTLATVQNWSSSGFTVTELNVNGNVLGTVSFSWSAIG